MRKHRPSVSDTKHLFDGCCPLLADAACRYPSIVPAQRSSAWSGKTLLPSSLQGEAIDLEKVAEPPVFMPESATGMDVQENFAPPT